MPPTQTPTRKRPPPRHRTAPHRPTPSGLVPTDLVPGRTVTYADHIIEQVNAGIDSFNAAQSAFVLPPEFQGWVRDGDLAYQRYTTAADPDHYFSTQLTAYEQDCALFVHQLHPARARAVGRYRLILEQHARGQLTRTKTVVKTLANGKTVTTTTTEPILSNVDVLMWLLERMAPDVYGQKASLVVAITDTTDDESSATLIEQRVAAILERRRRAIETTETDQ